MSEVSKSKLDYAHRVGMLARENGVAKNDCQFEGEERRHWECGWDNEPILNEESVEK